MLLAISACRCCVALWNLCCMAARGLLLLRLLPRCAQRCGAEIPLAACYCCAALARCTSGLRSATLLLLRCAAAVVAPRAILGTSGQALRIQALVTCFALLPVGRLLRHWSRLTVPSVVVTWPGAASARQARGGWLYPAAAGVARLQRARWVRSAWLPWWSQSCELACEINVRLV